jgi:4-diphosphocytidyl-2-C-methyl-D-erythritol kinase
MRVRAFAKINLSLRVLGPWPGGYHELRTVFQSIALHDTLTVRRARGPFTLACAGAGCPSDRTNLVWRAAGRLWKAAGRRGQPEGIAIHLAKRIPMRAGLGGGSSDAAATIRALGKLWGVDAGRQLKIAAALGADVPYFLEGGTVLGLNRGDLLFPLYDRPSSWVVLALPRFGVSTRTAYEWLDRQRGARRSQTSRRAGPEEGGAALVNDLQPVVVRHCRGIARLISILRQQGASHAAMSGAGSAVFGLFGSRLAAVRASRAFDRPDCRALVTRTIDRRTYRRLARN